MSKSKLQDYKGAIDDFNKTLQLTPTEDIQPMIYRERGDAKLELQDYKGAIADYSSSIQLGLPIVENYFAGGGDFGKAQGKIELLAKPYYKRGIAKDNLGDKVGACEDFHKSCSLGNATACPNSEKICGTESLAQSKATSPKTDLTSKLEGTAWETIPTDYGMGTIQCFYKFEARQKAFWNCIAVQRQRLALGSDINDLIFTNPNYPYRLKMITTPGGVGTAEGIGKYTQNGNSIRIEFSDAIMNVTVKGNTLTGETIPNDASKGGLRWTMHKTSDDSVSASVSSSQAVPKTLSNQILEKYNPIPLTSNIISGVLNTANDKKEYFYVFTAVPGQLIITLKVEADGRSAFNFVLVTIFDGNENIIGGVDSDGTNYGRTTEAIERINISAKQPLLLRIKPLNLGAGRYTIKLDGAYEQ